MTREGDLLLEDLFYILKDGDWHKVKDIANRLSLSIKSTSEILGHLVKANIVKSTDHQKKNELIKANDFVYNLLDLPAEKRDYPNKE